MEDLLVLKQLGVAGALVASALHNGEITVLRNRGLSPIIVFGGLSPIVFVFDFLDFP